MYAELNLSNETVTINGHSLKKIYGGFGQGQPCILAKQVAELHGQELAEINRIVNNNLDWFEEGIDYFNLSDKLDKYQQQIGFLINFYTRDALNASKYIYLFSQQGYALLCKFLRSDLAKMIYKIVIREYFSIRLSSDWLDKLPAECCNKAKDGHIYMIENPYGKVKIGKTINPVRRIKTIQTQGGFKAKKIFVSDRIRDYNKIESELHRYFRPFNFIGEWFSISYPIAIKAYYELCRTLLPHTKIVKNDSHHTFISKWWENHSENTVASRQLYELIERSKIPMNLGTGSKRSQKVRLGKLLVKMSGQQVGEYIINDMGKHKNVRLWKLKQAES